MTPLQSPSAVQAAACAARHLADAWNSTTLDGRREGLARAWHPDGWFVDAAIVSCGSAALARYIDAVRARVGDARFVVQRLQVLGGQVRFGWRLEHPRDAGRILLSGSCHARLGPDGRFTSLVSIAEVTPDRG